MAIMTGSTFLSPEIWHGNVDWYLVTNVSAFNSASILRVEGEVFSSVALPHITENNNLKKIITEREDADWVHLV